MKLKKGVSYHPYENKVFVHSVETRKDYILEGIALDVLNFFAEHKGGSLKNLCAALSAEYEIDESELQKDLCEFVNELLAEKILCEVDDEQEKPWTREIMQEVEVSFARSRKLFYMSLELTYRCVEKCIHCYIDDTPKFCATKELTLDEYKNILRQARQMGCVRILLTGGEVLLHKNFCDIAEYATSLGLIVEVYTTGVGLTDEIFDRLCATKVNSVSFSLYSGISTEHDAITGLPGSFEKTLKAMMMFKSAGVQTFIKCVAIRQNFKSLESVYKLGQRLKIRVSISPQIVSGHEQKKSCDYRLNAEQYEKFFALESRYSHLKNEDYTAEVPKRLESPPCSAGLNSMSIDPFGGVHPCPSFDKSVGSLREDSLENLWNKIGQLKYLQNFKLGNITPRCRTCEVVEFCHVCFGNLHKEQTDDSCGDTLVMARAKAAVAKHLGRR